MMEHFWQDGRFDEGWFTYPHFYEHMVKRVPNDAVMVEVGSWKGRSIAFLAVEALNSGKNIKVYSVDNWVGAEEMKFDGVKPVDDLYDVFLTNIAPIRDHINIIRGDSAESAKLFEDQSVDFVFIDASHEYENVKKDILAWSPKVKDGGVIAGHDIGWPGVSQAIRELLPWYFDAGGAVWSHTIDRSVVQRVGIAKLS